MNVQNVSFSGDLRESCSRTRRPSRLLSALALQAVLVSACALAGCSLSGATDDQVDDTTADSNAVAPALQNPQACVDANLGNCRDLAPGAYNTADLTGLGIADNTVSSIKIPSYASDTKVEPGSTATVTFYKDSNFLGPRYMTSVSEYNLTNASGGWDNTASSFLVTGPSVKWATLSTGKIVYVGRGPAFSFGTKVDAYNVLHGPVMALDAMKDGGFANISYYSSKPVTGEIKIVPENIQGLFIPKGWSVEITYTDANGLSKKYTKDGEFYGNLDSASAGKVTYMKVMVYPVPIN